MPASGYYPVERDTWANVEHVAVLSLAGMERALRLAHGGRLDVRDQYVPGCAALVAADPCLVPVVAGGVGRGRRGLEFGQTR